MEDIAYEIGGHTEICHPNYAGYAAARPDLTEDDVLHIVLGRDVPAGAINVTRLDRAAVAEMQKDRTFRDAWKPDLTVDMPKARAIHMDRIRVVRDKELARLDIEQLKGSDVAAQKQALRDIPQTFDLTAATTPDDLKALWPADLPKGE
jgi:hypothetical protein